MKNIANIIQIKNITIAMLRIPVIDYIKELIIIFIFVLVEINLNGLNVLNSRIILIALKSSLGNAISIILIITIIKSKILHPSLR